MARLIADRLAQKLGQPFAVEGKPGASGNLGTDAVAKIAREVSRVLTAADIREKLAAQLMGPIPGTPAEFRARIDADLVRWAPVIRDANIRIN